MGNNCKSACGCDTSEINTQQQFEVGYDKNKGLGSNSGANMGSQQNLRRDPKLRNTKE